MNIYRFQAVLDIHEKQKEVDVIIAAESNADAFKYAQIELERHYLKLPQIVELVLYEKKKITIGGGYVLDEAMD